MGKKLKHNLFLWQAGVILKGSELDTKQKKELDEAQKKSDAARKEKGLKPVPLATFEEPKSPKEETVTE